MNAKAIILTTITAILSLLATAQNGLVAHWSFDNMSGDTIFDFSGNDYHGNNYGAVIIDGKVGEALAFDGLNDYARITENGSAPPEVLRSLGKGSISLWFKVDVIPTDYGIAPMFFYGAEEMCDFFDAANQGMIIELGHSPIFPGSEELFFTMWKNGCTYPSFCFDSNFPIPEGEWVHFVAVVGEDFNTGYLNGYEMTNRFYNFGNSEESQFFEDAVVHEALWFGKGHWDETVQYFDGAIDEVRIYDRPLTSQEVEELYSDTAMITSVNSLPKPSSIKVHPNPASNTIYFDVSGSQEQPESIELIGPGGQMVLKQQVSGSSGKISLAGMTNGLYILKIYFDKGVIRKKVLINN